MHRGRPLDGGTPLAIAGSVLLTFLCAVVALVFFRAASVPAAIDIIKGMIGLNGITLPSRFGSVPVLGSLATTIGIPIAPLADFDLVEVVRIVLFLIVVWSFPNAYQWLRDHRTALDFKPDASWSERYLPAARWRPTAAVGVAVGAVSIVTLLYALSAAPTEFLYFQF